MTRDSYRQSASLTAGSRDASSTGDRRMAGPLAIEISEILYRAGRTRADSVVLPDRIISFAEWVQLKLDADRSGLLRELENMVEVYWGLHDDKNGDGALPPPDCIVRARAAIAAVSDHQNAPTDDATGQRSGLSP